MATRTSHSSKRPGRSRRSRKEKGSASNPASGVSVPEALSEAIEAQRDRLGRADSLLGCLGMSLEHRADFEAEPYYPDVVHAARELVTQAINGLDSVVLGRAVGRPKT